jgi:hypothetical protein
MQNMNVFGGVLAIQNVRKMRMQISVKLEKQLKQRKNRHFHGGFTCNPLTKKMLSRREQRTINIENLRFANCSPQV